MPIPLVQTFRHVSPIKAIARLVMGINAPVKNCSHSGVEVRVEAKSECQY